MMTSIESAGTGSLARLAGRMGGIALLLAIAGAGPCTGPEPRNYALELVAAGAGTGQLSTTPPSDDIDGIRHYYPDGTEVTVHAIPAAGSVFTGWGTATGPNAAQAGCTEPVNPCSAFLNDRRSVIGNFTLSEGVRRFDGDYTGTMTKDGNAGASPVELRITNGVVQGWAMPISGTLKDFTGTVADDGTFSATIPAGAGACPATLVGQFTTAATGTITAAAASGTFTFPDDPFCSAPNGTWAASRDQIPVTKTVAPVG